MEKSQIRSKIKQIFYNKILNNSDIVPENVQRAITDWNDILQKEIKYIKSDYENFKNIKRDLDLNFKYNYNLYKKYTKLKEKNYKKLLEAPDISNKDKIKYILSQHIIDKFNSSSFMKKTFPVEIFNDKKSNLTIKQWYNYNYFNKVIKHSARCCFCGQILEELTNEKEESYFYADIEHLIPKSRYPQFTFHPDNWFPCCKECNMGVKGDDFLKDLSEFYVRLNELNINLFSMKPLELYKKLKISYSDNDITFESANKLLKLYKVSERANLILRNCFSILFNIIKNSDIHSPESLEKLLENIASSNWHEINDGYSLNNSPQIWQEFIENILYDECKLMALWDEIKSSELRFL